MAKAIWPFRDLHAPSWVSGPRIDVPAEPPSHKTCQLVYIGIVFVLPHHFPKRGDLGPFFLFMEMPVPNQESQRSCICVLEVSILPLSTILGILGMFPIIFFHITLPLSQKIFLSDLGVVSTVWYFFHITRSRPFSQRIVRFFYCILELFLV